MTNQCTGCQRGLPISELGMHHDESGMFFCSKARYRMELEPISRDTWHQREKRDVPFVGGGV